MPSAQHIVGTQLYLLNGWMKKQRSERLSYLPKVTREVEAEQGRGTQVF